MADTRTLSGVRYFFACLGILLCLGMFGLGAAMATSKHARAFDYSSSGDAAADAFRAAFLASSGLSNLYGENAYPTNNTLCNSADYAGTVGNSMASLEKMLKAFIIPSMINEFACPKKMVDASNNMVMKTFSLLGGDGLASILPAIAQILSTVGAITSIVSMFTGGGSNLSMLGFGAQGLAKILGGNLSCGDMANILGAVAQAGFSFNPMLSGMMNGSGSGYISGTSGTGYSGGGSGSSTGGGIVTSTGPVNYTPTGAIRAGDLTVAGTTPPESNEGPYSESVRGVCSANTKPKYEEAVQLAQNSISKCGASSMFRPEELAVIAAIETNFNASTAPVTNGSPACGITQIYMKYIDDYMGMMKKYCGQTITRPSCQDVANNKQLSMDLTVAQFINNAQNFLSKRGNPPKHPEMSDAEWLVRAYNGGPGWEKSFPNVCSPAPSSASNCNQNQNYIYHYKKSFEEMKKCLGL